MLALAQIKNDKPHNVISITRHASFQKSGPAVQKEDPVEYVLHELLKPLTVINHSAKLLAEMQLGATEKGLVDKIAMSSATAMQYARGAQGATRLRRIMMNAREFRPEAMAADLVSTAQDFAFLNGVTLGAKVDSRVPEVLLAPDQRIAELLGVFLNNAIKRSRGQTINVSITGSFGTGVFFTVYRVEAPMPDMTEEAIDRITTFQEANAHIAALFCGRGIGMASCKGQAARVGGHITVKSSAGNGVAIELTVTSKLPVVYAEPLLLV